MKQTVIYWQGFVYVFNKICSVSVNDRAQFF